MEIKEYEIMAKMEERHWWFVARRHIISSVLSKLPLPENAKVLEIGCGSGGNLEMLAKFGEVYAIEPNDEARERAKQKGLAKAIEKVEMPNVPFMDERFDLIVLLDALEHIDDDKKTLEILQSVLKETGIIFITVPAMQFLWSEHDVVCHHKRRYNREGLNRIIEEAGYRVKSSSYYNTILFPIIGCIRILKRFVNFGNAEGSDLSMPADFLNNLLERIFASEAKLLEKFSLPFGVSLMATATKN